MPKKAKNSFKMGNNPELDSSPKLKPYAASYYLTIIGILRWMIDLGRIDIITKMLFLFSHVVLPREGHSETVIHLIGHIGQ